MLAATAPSRLRMNMPCPRFEIPPAGPWWFGLTAWRISSTPKTTTSMPTVIAAIVQKRPRRFLSVSQYAWARPNGLT